MTDASRLTGLLLLIAVAMLRFTPASGAEFTIGYLQLKSDSRYARTRTYAQFLTEALGRPYKGARVALDEMKFHGAGAGVEFRLERLRERDAAGLVTAIGRMREQGARFFVADLPAATLASVAEATAGQDILLLNATTRADSLRQEGCQRHLLHIIPSQRMMMDALAQYMAVKRWREILVLQGPSTEDQAMGDAFVASSAKFGLQIVANRSFVLSNDPRERARNNILLLTGKDDYDAIFVADADGEFARGLPYRSVLPRPVIGAAGLGAAAWHWAWERHGAPQLEGRFERLAGRPMRDQDWAVWMAVKAIGEAVQRTASAEFGILRDYLLGPTLALDSFKGSRNNFRSWNNQLRQPVLLVTQTWVVARAPLPGFEHRINDLDTLGIDEPESRCRFQ